MSKRKSYTPEFKLTIVLETIKQGKLEPVARSHGLTTGLISNWRKTLLKQGHLAFSKSTDKEKEQLKKQVNKLEQMIGQREVELTMLKNFAEYHT